MEKISAKLSLYDRTTTSVTILYLTNNKAQFRLALNSIYGSDFEYVVYWEGFDEVDLDNIFVPKNAIISNCSQSVLMMMSGFKCAITTVGHNSPVLSQSFKDLISSIIEIEMPLIDVPHGLFQIGFNIKDNSKILDAKSMDYGMGMFVPSLGTHQISWFEECGPGFPVDKNYDRVDDVICVPDYIVITTNTNWYLYDHFSQRLLYNAIWEYACCFENCLFIWCPHPAELNDDCYGYYVKHRKPSNIFIYGCNNEIYFDGIDTTEDVIKHANYGISTVSTCLLSYEQFKVDVLVFNSDTTSNLISNFKKISTFRNYDELATTIPKEIKTNMLFDYDVHKFDRLIKGILA